MNDLKKLEIEIELLKQRNAKVDADKAWETSFARRSILALFTYLAIGVYLAVLNIPNPWINAIVPAVAFMLSTLTLPIFKEMWLKNRKKQ